MKKKLFIFGSALLFFLLAVSPISADSQLEIGVNIPTIIGVSYEGENVSEQIPFTIPIPDLMYNYYFGSDTLRVGVGVRVWTLILVSGGYPIISAELNMDRLVFNAHIGGGIFAYGSVWNSDVLTGDVFLPEISASYQFTDWFSLGASVLGIYVPELTEDGFGYLINIVGRFRVIQ
jgi:hypothetical protein